MQMINLVRFRIQRKQKSRQRTFLKTNQQSPHTCLWILEIHQKIYLRHRLQYMYDGKRAQNSEKRLRKENIKLIHLDNLFMDTSRHHPQQRKSSKKTSTPCIPLVTKSVFQWNGHGFRPNFDELSI